MAPLKDMTQRANVSLMTVSRAINEPERLQPETYKEVMKAIDALGYIFGLSARKIHGTKTTANTIGMLVLDAMITSFPVEITPSIEETTRVHDWNSPVVSMFSNDKPEKTVDLLSVHRPDGIIYTAIGLCQVPVPEKLHKYRYILANYGSMSGPFPTYIPDNEQR